MVRVPTCLVRPAALADAPVAIAVLRSSIAILCFADHSNDPAALERWLRNKTEPSFAKWLADTNNFIVVCEIDAIIRGVGLINASGRVGLCYVEPGFQRRGVGRALLQSLEERAIAWGLSEVSLSSSVGARDFYEREGYVSTGQPEVAFGTVTGYPYAKVVRSPTARS